TTPRRISHHTKRESLVNLHAASPTVVHQRWICAVLPGCWIVQHLPHPWAQNIAGTIRTATKAADKNRGRCEYLMGQQTSAKGSRIRIQAGGAVNERRIALQC